MYLFDTKFPLTNSVRTQSYLVPRVRRYGRYLDKKLCRVAMRTCTVHSIKSKNLRAVRGKKTPVLLHSHVT